MLQAKMIFKTGLFFVALLSIVQVWYRLKLPAILTKEILFPNDHEIFSRDFKTLVLLIGLLLLLSVFGDSRKTAIKPLGIYWMIGFILTLAIVAGSVAVVNPTGRFPWNERESYVSVAARSIKPALYAKQKETPELIILGSSVSFTIPASYFKNKWGVSAFNMSLNGGGPSDFLATMHYILQKSPDGKAPLTVLVEVLSPALKLDNSNQAPVKMFPYMPVENRFAAMSDTVNSLITVSPLSDVIFTKLFFDTHRWKVWIKFSNDGSGVRIGEQENRSAYQAAVKSNIDMMRSLISCKELNAKGKAYIEKLIDLSARHHFSIVFYRAPINNDFYKISNTKPGQYKRCKKEFDNYMALVTQKNRNVFYKDLSQYTKISTKGMSMYMDTHHLKSPGSILLMRALDTELETALAWAKQK